MKFFTRNGIFKKTIICILFVILCNFSMPAISYGKFDIVDPITNFLCQLPDGIFWILQSSFMGNSGDIEISVHTDKPEEFEEENQEGMEALDEGVSVRDIAPMSLGSLGPVGGVAGLGITVYNIFSSLFSSGADFNLINIEYTPYAMFANKIALLNADFFHSDSSDYLKPDQSEDSITNSVDILKPVVSKWYGILRSVAIVGLLIVLIYLAIRIIISSSSQDKAKFKKILADWFVAMILIFVLHYIMSFTMLAIKNVSKMFAESRDMESMYVKMPSDLECTEGENDTTSNQAFEEHKVKDENGNWTGYWKMNIVEWVRFKIVAMEDQNVKKLGFTIMYIFLCIITCMFTFQYLKRVIYLAILTILAPIIALTYPLDKLADGKAQGFNMWLKEYIFNALLQVMHLLLYTIIVSSAVELINSNVIYGIVALGCLTMTEKLLRKLFGFEKASTVGAFGGAAGAALLMSQFNKMKSIGASAAAKKATKNTAPKLYSNTKSLDAEKTLKDNTSMQKASQPQSEEQQSSQPNTNQQQSGNQQPGGQQTGKPKTDKQQSGNQQSGGQQASKLNTNQQQTGTQQKGQPNASQTQTGNGTKKKVSGAKSQALKYAGRQFRRRIINKNNAKKLGRAVLKGAGATLGATAGLAAGIAAGDPKKAVEYAAAGAMATGTLTGKVGHAVAQGTSNIVSDYKQGLAIADENYAEEQRYNEFIKNKENKQYIESRYMEKEEREEVYKMARESAKDGTYSAEEVSAMYEMKKNNKVASVEQARAVAKLSNKMGDISKPKDKKEQLNYLIDDCGFTKENAENVIGQVEAYKKYQK